MAIARPHKWVRPGGRHLEQESQVSRESSPKDFRFFSMWRMSMRDAFCGSASTAKVAPTTSSNPSALKIGSDHGERLIIKDVC